MTYYLCCRQFEVPFSTLGDARVRLLEFSDADMPCGEHWIEDGSDDVTFEQVAP